MDLVQTKQKRAAREQWNTYKPRTETRTTPSNQTRRQAGGFFAGDTVVLKQSIYLGKTKKSIAPESLSGTSERRFELLSCREDVRKSRRPFAKFAISFFKRHFHHFHLTLNQVSTCKSSPIRAGGLVSTGLDPSPGWLGQGGHDSVRREDIVKHRQTTLNL